MSSFLSYLGETFNYSASYQWSNFDYDEVTAIFSVNQIEYLVTFNRDEEIDDKWSVMFDLLNPDSNHEPFSPTKLGNNFTVLSTVKNIIVDFVNKRNDVSFIYWTADSPSRIKAYNRMASAIDKELSPKWRLETFDNTKRFYVFHT